MGRQKNLYCALGQLHLMRLSHVVGPRLFRTTRVRTAHPRPLVGGPGERLQLVMRSQEELGEKEMENICTKR